MAEGLAHLYLKTVVVTVAVTVLILQAAAGVGVGIGAAILFAPASGQEIRSSISDKVQDIGDRVRDRFSSSVSRDMTGTEGR